MNLLALVLTLTLEQQHAVRMLTDAAFRGDVVGTELARKRVGDVSEARMQYTIAFSEWMDAQTVGGDTVALDPGGFWNDREVAVFGATLRPSIALVRALRGTLPALLGNPVGRTLLLVQLSARHWALSRETVLPDVRGLAESPSTGAALDALTKGPKQQGAPAGTVPGRVTIGWGRRDLVTLPRQAARATELFPDAVLHWFERCGHFPQWDAPHEATRLILDSTS